MLHGAGVTKLWCRNIDQQLLRELHEYEILENAPPSVVSFRERLLHGAEGDTPGVKNGPVWTSRGSGLVQIILCLGHVFTRADDLMQASGYK